jgi:serine/threonine-protein kinase PknK
LGLAPPPTGSRFAIDADPVRAGLAIARTAQRLGELDAAEATLAELHAAHPTHPEVAGTYARLLVLRARYQEARDVAAAAGPLAGLRAEAAGLAALHLGELDAADLAFAALEVEAATAGHGAAGGHAARLRGMVAHRRGQLGLASDRYREAARRLGEAGERHAAAAAELDLGTVLVERGRASEALVVLASAGTVLGELGSAIEACVVDLQRSRALLRVGQLDGAMAAAQAALARTDQAPQLRSRALIAAGEAGKRLGDEPAALRSYREALAVAVHRGDARDQLRAHVALAEAGQRDGDGLAIDALCTGDDDRARWILARGRLALRDPAALASPDAAVTLARACAEVAARAVDEDRLERAFRGHAIAAQLAQRARELPLARGEAERARLAHAALSAATAPAYRAAIDGDPDLARLPGSAPGAPDDAPRSGAGDAPAHPVQAAPLRRLLTLSRRLHTEPSLERIFDDVIDAAIELTGAERGCLLLRRLDGELAIAVARNWFDDGPDGASRAPSRAIAERAAQTGETVLAVDPALQARAAAQRIRSVLAVPLRQRGTIAGSLYVDHRVRGGAFDAAAAAVLAELADLAAIAIENARRAADLRRAIREADERNAHLVAELAAHDAALARVTGELAAAQARPAPVHPRVGEDLALRPVLAATEQAYIAAAMSRAQGNQTAAARLLGLSRFGLQKKLRRQSTDGDPA